MRPLVSAAAIATLAFLLAGCVSDEEQRSRDMALDNARCQSYGFAAGSPALAQCLDTAAATRSADADRQAAYDREWQRKQDRDWRQFNRDLTQDNGPPNVPAPAPPPMTQLPADGTTGTQD